MGWLMKNKRQERTVKKHTNFVNIFSLIFYSSALVLFKYIAVANHQLASHYHSNVYKCCCKQDNINLWLLAITFA